MQVFGVLPDLTLLHVVLLRILEALLDVLLDLFEERILPRLQSTLDIIKSYGSFDLFVVVRVLSL